MTKNKFVETNETLALVGRNYPLFKTDIQKNKENIDNAVSRGKFLVLGGAGTVGQAVTYEIFKRNPKLLHVVDISENNLVELVRNLRSSLGYIKGDFKTFALDCGSNEFHMLMKEYNEYDYILNLSALKHVRSEEDPFTLMRMIDVNILNTIRTIEIAKKMGVKKYFCVSSDKAAGPVNMMGASKRIMEMFLYKFSESIPVSTARFANVAFSDGSLLHSFKRRFEKNQPLAAPLDTLRYFLTSEESGELCLMACILGNNRDNFFPSSKKELKLISFPKIAQNFLKMHGYEAFLCANEKEARDSVLELKSNRKWPCYFFESNTTGEKETEDFYTLDEKVDWGRFNDIGVIRNDVGNNSEELDFFLQKIYKLRNSSKWDKKDLVELFKGILEEFTHEEKGIYLDSKM